MPSTHRGRCERRCCCELEVSACIGRLSYGEIIPLMAPTQQVGDRDAIAASREYKYG
jgi:hypothetical protein